MMLEAAWRLTLPPASNLPDAADTTWFHLLPSLDLATAVCVGTPPATLGRLLRRHARHSIVVEPGQRITLPSDVASCDLLVFANWRPHDVEWATQWLVPQLDEVTNVALLTSLGNRRFVAPSARSAIRRLSSVLSVGGGWYLIPARRATSRTQKRIRRALSLARARINSRLGLSTKAGREHASDLRTFHPVVLGSTSSRPHGTILGTESPLSELPPYLLDIGTLNGLQLAGRPWSYGPGRGFRSQKVVFIVASDEAGGELVIKSTQEPRFNERLGAEVAALTAVRRAGIENAFEAPEVLFTAKHAGLLIVAETKLEGGPFRRLALPSPGDRLFSAGIEAITALGAATARSASADELGAAAHNLVAAFCAAFSPPGPIAHELTAASERLAQISAPAVLQHGDFGVWNLLAKNAGSPIGILDWENADPAGMPLWDLFVFARTFGVFMADAAGVRYGPTVFRSQLLEPTSLRAALVTATEDYCDQLDVPADAAGDLFTLCWVQQALREAATLPTPSWESAQRNRYIEASLRTPFRLSE